MTDRRQRQKELRAQRRAEEEKSARRKELSRRIVSAFIFGLVVVGAIVVMTMPGKPPTKELISAANNISDHWISYWSKTTNGRSTMTVTPK